MRLAVDNGVSLFDATEQADFEDWKDVSMYVSNQRANASFVCRETEQAFFDQWHSAAGRSNRLAPVGLPITGPT